jgi:LPS sulfotransferase NodH
MNKLFTGFGKKTLPRNKPVIVVSGLPRSGTSMMMKILAEAGVPIVTDELRRADTDNPNGYYELEAVKQMSAGNLAWLAGAGGKAVKVISSLLEYLPAQYSYQIIFMERETREVLASQRKMLERRNEKSEVDDGQIAEQFRKHLSVIKPWLARQPNMEVLYISYNSLMSNPEPSCRRVIDFISCEPQNLERMLSVPNGELYRNRAAGS